MNTKPFTNAMVKTTTINFDHSEMYSYGKVDLGKLTFEQYVYQTEILTSVIEIINKLDKDPYVDYTIMYLSNSMDKYKEHWKYADIATVLFCLSKLLRPENYLEIGVRKGRSMVMVTHNSPKCEVYGFDMWIDNYAEIENPGKEFVVKELEKFNYQGNSTFIEGDSHVTLKKFFTNNPNISFDLITVDGDHSFYGAVQDLVDVLSKVRIGGALVFDDIAHPEVLYLQEVWRNVVKSNPRFSTWEYTDIGYGVGVAIRRY